MKIDYFFLHSTFFYYSMNNRGSLNFQLKWYKDNEKKPIVPSSRIHLDRSGHDHILKIVKTQQSDFGEYTCEAKNSEGQESAVIRLTGNFHFYLLIFELKKPFPTMICVLLVCNIEG